MLVAVQCVLGPSQELPTVPYCKNRGHQKIVIASSQLELVDRMRLSCLFSPRVDAVLAQSRAGSPMPAAVAPGLLSLSLR